MKKLLTLTIALAALCGLAKTLEQIRSEYAALSGADAKNSYIKNSLSTEDWRLLADDFIACAATNKAAAVKQKPAVLGWIGGGAPTPNAAVLASEYDPEFLPTGLVPPSLYKSFPLSVEAYLSATNGFAAAWKAAHPARIASIRRNGDGFLPKNASPAERANLLAEECAWTMAGAHRFWGTDVEKEKKLILAQAPRVVKRHIREQGETFVQQNGGSNVVQAAVNVLSTALDAPKMQGLKEWCQTYCPAYQWVEVNWLPSAEFKEIADAYLYGDRTLGDSGKMMLQGYLGVREYNNWVREYNGED